MLETKEQIFSYGAGFQVASQIVSDPALSIDKDLLLAGFTAAIKGEEGKVTPEQFQQALKEIQDAQRLEAMAAAEANRKAGEDFLAENAKKDGVVTLDSGVQYVVLNSGKGDVKPLATEQVVVHYHGTLIDGTVFDSSVERGEPATFPVNGVVSGFRQALELMTVGDKWRVFIPSGMAYGPQSPGPLTKPNSALIFELELIEIVKDDAAE